jgi:hypothetical protein
MVLSKGASAGGLIFFPSSSVGLMSGELKVSGIEPLERSRLAGSQSVSFLCFIKDAEIHFFGVKVDSAIKFVLFGVKSHLVSSFFIGSWFFGETHNTIFLEEAFNSINGLDKDAREKRHAPVSPNIMPTIKTSA